MLIQGLQKLWIGNPSLLMPTALYWIVLTRVRLVWIFQSTTFQVIGLPQSKFGPGECLASIPGKIWGEGEVPGFQPWFRGHWIRDIFWMHSTK